MGARFTELTIDAADVEALARFWSAVLGWPVLGSEDGVVEIGEPTGSVPTLVFAGSKRRRR